MQLAAGCRLPLLAALGPWGLYRSSIISVSEEIMISGALSNVAGGLFGQRSSGQASTGQASTGQASTGQTGSAAVVKQAFVKLAVQQWPS